MNIQKLYNVLIILKLSKITYNTQTIIYTAHLPASVYQAVFVQFCDLIQIYNSMRTRLLSAGVSLPSAAVTFPPLGLPHPKLVLDLATSEGCKAELNWVVVISQDSLPAKYGHISQK